MSELRVLQRQFQEFLLTSQQGIEESVRSTISVSKDTRLGIYRDAYQLRLIECLITSYPALHLYLGTEEFQKLCRAYIDAYPSPFRSIRWYGNHLADFLRTNYPDQFLICQNLLILNGV